MWVSGVEWERRASGGWSVALVSIVMSRGMLVKGFSRRIVIVRVAEFTCVLLFSFDFPFDQGSVEMLLLLMAVFDGLGIYDVGMVGWFRSQLQRREMCQR